ncbi:MAG: hypothetical protein GYB36_06315 [Alphaproteobacteria bacterium]|nr:hypothetical protein [Alphaproteobacteria bacterium]
MITLFRNFAKSPFAYVIIGLLVAAFAFYGVGGIFTGSGTAVAIVGKEQVSVTELRGAYEREISMLQEQYPDFTREQATEFGLGDQVLQRLISEAAFSSKSQELGLAVSDDTLVNSAAQIPAFRNPITGQYDFNTMREILQLNGYTVDQFQSEHRGNLLRAQLTAAIGTGVNAPDAITQTRFTVSGEQRSLRGLFIDANAAQDVEAPDEETLRAFIESNRGATDPQTGLPIFLAPEMRAISLVRFQLEDFLRDVEVDEAPLREFYEFQLESGQIGTPAQRTFSQVNVNDEATANAIVARIAGGEALADIADELGLGAPFAQDDVQLYEVPDEGLGNAVFEAAVGDSFAVEGTFGWYAVDVTGGIEADLPSFEEQLPELREAAARDEALNALYDRVGAFTDARDAGATLEDAAQQAGTPIEIFAAMDRFGRDMSLEIDFTRYASLGPEILPFAFEQFEGIESELEQFNETDFFVLRVDEVVEEQLRPFEDVSDIAAGYWRAERVDAQLDELADEALAQLQAGENMDVVALTSGGRVEVATLSREQTAGLFSQAVVGQAFNQNVGEFGLVVGTGTGVKAIVVVDEVMIPDLDSADAASLATFSEEIDNAISTDILLAAQNALYAEYGLNDGGVDPRLRALALGESDQTFQ